MNCTKYISTKHCAKILYSLWTQFEFAKWLPSNNGIFFRMDKIYQCSMNDIHNDNNQNLFSFDNNYLSNIQFHCFKNQFLILTFYSNIINSTNEAPQRYHSEFHLSIRLRIWFTKNDLTTINFQRSKIIYKKHFKTKFGFMLIWLIYDAKTFQTCNSFLRKNHRNFPNMLLFLWTKHYNFQIWNSDGLYL